MMRYKKNHFDQDRLNLLKTVAGNGPVLILTHDNPDPDAMASGKALAVLLGSAWGTSSKLIYSGLVHRAENRAMLHHLTHEWEHSDVLTELDQYSAIAMVDTQPEAGNNRLPSSHIPQIVFDHHQPFREKLRQVPFTDIRSEIGATVTLLHQYLEMAQITIDTDLATAMFYGLKTDTRGLSRGASPMDKEVYLKLLGQIDYSKLIQIEQAGLSRIYFRAFSNGLHVAKVFNQSVVANLGKMHRPDLVAEMADLLIRLDIAKAVLCLGIHNQILHLSIRTEPMGQDAGLIAQKVIIPPGKAGGHGAMAGGQIPIIANDGNQLSAEIIQRFLDFMGEHGEGSSLCHP